MNIGRIYYTVISPSEQRLFALIKEEGIEAYDITSKNGRLYIGIKFFQKASFERICKNCGCQIEQITKTGVCRFPEIIKNRIGLIIGTAVCAAVILALKNYTVSIEVLTDNDKIRSDVLNVLSDNGITSGTYIPSINLVQTERALKQDVEGISWAGISVTDSTLIVDVIEELPQTEKSTERMPSDLIAAHDGVIEDIELYNGLLVKPLGSGVLRGDVIVSGSIPVKKTELKEDGPVTVDSTKYVRSIGKVYGTYTDIQTFEQPYADTELAVSPKSFTRKYLNIFSSQIPLFIGSDKGMYISSEEYRPLTILGEQTPIGMTETKYQSYSFKTTLYTKKQAKKLAAQKRDDYEKNFLSDCSIKGRHTDVEYKKDRVVLTVKYTIYGEMSEESYFFIKK